MKYSRLKRILFSRPSRFALLAFVAAIVFSEARLLILLLMLIFLISAAIGETRKHSFYLTSLLVLCACGLILHVISTIDTARIRNYMAAHTPPEPASAQDGVYKGTGIGPRGPTDVYVEMQRGVIRDIALGHYLDAVSIDREAINLVRNRIIAGNSLDLNPDLIDRTPAIRGFYDAVCNALWAADPGVPSVSPLSRITYFFTRNNLSRRTFNALAIVFITFLLIDFFLQSILMKDTGQSLVCYNCQTCVGVCPIKMIEGAPYPMTMVLETRLGNYSRVVELARYCVGCGRCAGKCPAGISAPRLAAAAVSLVANEKRFLQKPG
jgi:ferredoxin/uncharacterized protein with FMN-binding domain